VWLLFKSSYYSRAATIRERLLFESGYYSRAVFIKLGIEDEEIHCLKEGGVAADARESTRSSAHTSYVTQQQPFKYLFLTAQSQTEDDDHNRSP